MAAAPDGRGMAWDDGLECWVVSDPALARVVLHHPGFSSRTSARLGELYMTEESRERFRELTEFLRLWFVHTDGVEHAALRRPMQSVLSTAYFRSITPTIESIVDSCLDNLAAVQPHDFVPAVAEGVSGAVMAHIVGVDAAPAVLHEWSRTLSSFIAAMYRRDHAEKAHRVMLEMSAALADAPAVRGFPRGTPQDRARTTASWAMILFGGLETTASLLGSTVLAALDDRATWAGVRAGDVDVDAFVEAVLVGTPPLRNVGRVVAEDADFAGHRLTAGDLVLVALGGGDLLSDEPTGRGEPQGANLTFGHGVHYCIGAPLARIEATTTLRALARRFPDARLPENAAVWGPNLSYVGLDHLYLDLSAALGARS